MGTADLSGSFAKLGRAKEHFDAFNEKIWMFVGQESKPTLIECRYEEGWYVIYSYPLPPFPLGLALVVGDCLTNMRSALDHLVWQLVLREDQAPRQTHSFPICNSRQEFMNKVETPAQRGRQGCPLYGIPIRGDAWTVVEGAQPFHGRQPEHTSLSLLAHLSNIDKHRMLLVQRSFFYPQWVTDYVRWRADLQPVECYISPVIRSLEQPAEVARFRFPPGVDPRVQVDGPPHLEPIIGDGETYIGVVTLAGILGEIRKILEQVAALPRVQR